MSYQLSTVQPEHDYQPIKVTVSTTSSFDLKIALIIVITYVDQSQETLILRDSGLRIYPGSSFIDFDQNQAKVCLYGFLANVSGQQYDCQSEIQTFYYSKLIS